MQKVYAFDFDGTLTTHDTLLAFIKYSKGLWGLVWVMLLHLPWLVLMKLKLYPNDKAKQRVFSHCFAGMPLPAFEAMCRQFAQTHQHLLRPEGMATLRQAIAQGHSVVIVSASIDRWVAPFFAPWPEVQVVGTQVEVVADSLTGRFSSPNCYGAEKVHRLCMLFPDRTQYTLTAFGDSRGDKALLAYADEAHYKPFR